MTITPEQAMKLNEDDRAEVGALEKTIDQTISSRFNQRDRRVCVDTGYVGNKALQEIKQMYNEAGWNVKYQSDQRDGDFLEFTPKRNYGGQR